MSQKYIRLKEFNSNNDIILIFPNVINHSEYVSKLGYSSDDVISAGFIALNKTDKGNIVYKCYGESVSLRKKSIPEEDYYLINREIYSLEDMDYI